MSLKSFRCCSCHSSFLAFESEPERIFCSECGEATHIEKLPPNPIVAHASSRIMVDYLLDSIYAIHQSTSDMIRQKADEREYKQYQKALRR